MKTTMIINGITHIKYYESFRIHQVSSKVSLLADIEASGHINNDFTNGIKGYSKARRGVKKFINSRIRFHENQITKKLMQDYES